MAGEGLWGVHPSPMVKGQGTTFSSSFNRTRNTGECPKAHKPRHGVNTPWRPKVNRLTIRPVMNNNANSQAGAPAGAQLHRPATPPQRILVADDDRDVRRVIAHALMGSGYHADTAEDGAAAWETIQIKAFNLLITDHNMPKLTGVELVRKLRSARMALPVILVTGKLPTEALAQNPSLRLAAMLPKPFSIDELLETVRTVLRATDHAPESLEPLPDSRSQ